MFWDWVIPIVVLGVVVAIIFFSIKKKEKKAADFRAAYLAKIYKNYKARV